jgi:hypothetical protein
MYWQGRCLPVFTRLRAEAPYGAQAIGFKTSRE